MCDHEALCNVARVAQVHDYGRPLWSGYHMVHLHHSSSLSGCGVRIIQGHAVSAKLDVCNLGITRAGI